MADQPFARITRRQSIRLGTGAIAAALSTGARCLPERSFSVTGTATLAERASRKGILFGAASSYQALSSDLAYANRVAKECRILVAENEFKWGYLCPAPGHFDFTKADWLMKFAQQHRLKMRGHTLVWHISQPSWLEAKLNRGNAEKLLTTHIQKVVGRYAGRIHSWDVVNEAIEPSDGRPDGLRKTAWLEHLGPDYMELAFRTAAAADPKAMLVYNDYNFECKDDGGRRSTMLKWLERLKSRGTPIHALGIQSHLLDQGACVNAKILRQFLSEVANLGLKILITELDASDQHLPADVKLRDRATAAAYEDYLSIVLEEPAVKAVLTWGLSDRYSWLSEFYPRKDKLPVRPLPFDDKLQPKLVWNAMARAFDRAPKR